MKPFERIQPASWMAAAQALEGARRSGVAAEPKGAGTDLLDRLKERTAAPDRVVDLRRLAEHDRIAVTPSQIRIGALTTLTAVTTDATLRGDYPALVDACEGAATPQIRNAATLAGNLCQRPRCWYFRSADFTCLKKGGSECYAQTGESRFHAVIGNKTCAIVHPSAAGVALLAYGASVETLRTGGSRSIPIEGFFSAPEATIGAENSLASDELVTEIVLPRKPAIRSAYRKVKHKQTFDWPLAEAAVVYTDDNGVARDVRIVLGAAAPVPWRARFAERLVEGRRIDPSLAEAASVAAVKEATPLAHNAYKVLLLVAVVRRALLAAARLPDRTESAPNA